jgi:catechol 2,3-dioxygenase-like lactoylglutathione lyase family enzyme
MLCKKLSHAAYRCRDANTTARFYVDVLGLKMSNILGSDHIPSTGEYDPHVHLFFELEDGSAIAFFEAPLGAGGVKNEEMPSWLQHFAFEVENLDALIAAKRMLEDKGLEVLGPVVHGEWFRSIYFFDPDGHRLELTVHLGTSEMKAAAERKAPEILARWNRTHSWSEENEAAH